MSWAVTTYGRAPWAAGEIPNVPPPGWVDIPPPIPGGTAAFTYTAQTAVSPWAMRSWAGASPILAYPGGGISVAPDPENGVMRIAAWWPDAPILQIVRVGQSGTRTPVRGAYGLRVSGVTRRNVCSNPSVEAGLNGYLPIDGNTTLSSSTVSPYVAHGTTAMRMVSTTTTTGATMPGTLSGNGQWTVGLNLGLTATPAAVTVTVAWLTSTGTSAGSNVLTLTADQIAAAVGQSYRAAWTFSAPAVAVTGSVSMSITGFTAGQLAYLDAVSFEKGATSGSYFDGSTSGGQWSGTANLSTSTLAPIQVLADGECPLDTPVAYEVYNPAITGGSVAASAQVLESGGRTWLTHPTRGSGPVRVDLRETPARVHEIEQGVFWALDRTRPIVVSAAQRRAPTGQIGFNAVTVEERDTLLDRFGDGSPVLLRCPADYNRGEGTWYVLGALTEDPEGRKAWQDAWLLSAPYYEVDSPDPALVA